MGLDMYLKKYPRVDGLRLEVVDLVECHVCYSGKVDKSELPKKETLEKLVSMVHTGYYAWDVEKVHPRVGISDQVGYWRKANAIHKWFVDRIQEGIDDCLYHRPVTKDDLADLAERCREVLSDPTGEDWPELLPTEAGFFFGSIAYDEWYLDDIKKTLELCETLIQDFDFENYDLYYISSW